MKYRVKKKWVHDGTEYKVGALLDIDDAVWAKAKIKEGYIEFEEEEEKSDDANEPEDEQDEKGGTAVATKVASKGSKKRQADASDEDGSDEDGNNEKQALYLEDLQHVVDQIVSRKTGVDRPNIQVVKDNMEGNPTFGYKTLNEYLLDVKAASQGGTEARERLLKRAQKAIGSDEYATVEDSIGGFLVPPEYRTDLLRKEVETEFVMNPSLGNAMVININSTMLKMNVEVDITRAGDVLFGGVTVYRTPERTTMTSARGKFEQVEWKPEDMTGLAYVTDNQLHHASNISQILGRQFRDAFQYKRTGEFLFGNGVGQSLGMVHASNGALLSQTRASAGAISTDDCLNMFYKCWDVDNAIWLAGWDAFPSIMKLSVSVGVAGAPVMLFNMADQGKPATLLGRPIIFTEFAGALGAVNDLMLLSMPHYVIAYTSRMVNDSSIHVRYESNETAFRFVEQFQGMPWWRQALTLRSGVQKSPFITLAA